LAAGASRRLGHAKQLLPFRGEPLLRVVAREVCGSQCRSVAIVIYDDNDAIRASVEDLPVTIISNPVREEGIASSIRAGVAWARATASDGLVLVACDQPAITSAHIDVLLERARRGAAAVASRYDGAIGIPAFFASTRFEPLLTLRGASGAKRVLAAEPEVAVVDWPEGAFDVDTPEDAASLSHW
jgi:CTP:molybdopterin cytidylyltransferase MocA